VAEGGELALWFIVIKVKLCLRIQIGDVVDAVGSGRSKLLNGKEYDYVFDVQLDMDTRSHSGPPLKIGYNTSEDPWFAAQRFLQDNDLSPLYLDQVANFIIESTKGATIGSAQPTVSDPFTGGTRYIPPSVSEIASKTPPVPRVGQPLTDPLTGGSRYIPSYSQPPPVTTPFQSPVGSQVSATTNTYFPKTTVITFDAISNMDALFNKLSGFNNNAKPSLKLSDVAVQRLREIISLHDSPLKMSSQMDDVVHAAIDQLLQWPDDIIFPGIDIIRIIVKGARGNEYLCSNGDSLVGRLKLLVRSESSATNCMLALRLMTNMFTHPSGCQLLVSKREEILHCVSGLASKNKGIQVALCSLILNFAVETQKLSQSSSITGILTALSVVLLHQLDAEAAFRALVAVGTVVCISQEAVAQAVSLGIQQTVSNYCNVLEPKKVGECARLLVDKLAVHS
jgi:phospholipase A-2-activating protein